MEFRLRAVRGLAVLLYIGPLFAGLGGLGPGMILPFVGIFVAWLAVLRPEQFPVSIEEWATGAAWAAVLGQVLSQTLLVCVLLAIGRGLGAIADLPPFISPYFPLAISFLAIPLCRMLWDSGSAATVGVFLDDDARAAHAPRAVAQAAASVVPLLNLADDAPDGVAAHAVADVMAIDGPEQRLKALTAALSNPDRSHASLRRAIVLWATEPEIVAQRRVRGAAAHAFEIAGRNADLLRLYLPRALALIGAFPDFVSGFPTADEVRGLAEAGFSHSPDQDLPDDLRADLGEGLLALAAAIDKATAAQTAVLASAAS